MPCDTPELQRSRLRTQRLFNRSVPAFWLLDLGLLPRYRQVLEQLDLPAELTVLDVGTGSGCMALAFAELGHAVTGVDFAERLLRRARRRVPAATFLHLDLADLPRIESGSHDVLALAHVLHGLDPELRRFTLAEARRIARRWVVVVDYAARGPWYVRLIESVSYTHLRAHET